MENRWTRFHENVEGNPHRGRSFFDHIGAKLPTSEQMDEMDKYNITYDVDEELRNVTIEASTTLSRNGFVDGCALVTSELVRIPHGFVDKYDIIQIEQDPSLHPNQYNITKIKSTSRYPKEEPDYSTISYLRKKRKKCKIEAIKIQEV